MVIVTIALLGFAAAPALGATVTQAPTISGDSAQLAPGTKLTASTGSWTPASASATYDWLRCDRPGTTCMPISGACGRRYTVRGDDVGHTLRVRLTVTEPGQTARVRHVRRDRDRHIAYGPERRRE